MMMIKQQRKKYYRQIKVTLEKNKNQKHKKVLQSLKMQKKQPMRTTTKKKKQPQQQRKKKKQLPLQKNKEDNGGIRGDIISTQHHHKSNSLWLLEAVDSCFCVAIVATAFSLSSNSQKLIIGCCGFSIFYIKCNSFINTTTTTYGNSLFVKTVHM